MKNFLVFLLLFFSYFIYAQNEPPPILQKLEVLPQYPGGEVAMYDFFAKHINYPKLEKEMGIIGKVIVRFAIDTVGKVTNFKVLSNTPKAFNDEVIRVMKLMPNWKPGMQDGKPVTVYFTLPVKFQLDDEKSNIAEYIGIACGLVIGILLYKWLF